MADMTEDETTEWAIAWLREHSPESLVPPKTMCRNHPDRVMHAKGLCRYCYDTEYKASRVPRCHPLRKHASGGKCWACYRGNQWVEDAREDLAVGVGVATIAKEYGKPLPVVKRWAA